MYVINENAMQVSGHVLSDLTKSHMAYDQQFYIFTLGVKRLSGQMDHLPVVVSADLCERCLFSKGSYVCVSGQLRSYNDHANNGSRLQLRVYTKDLFICEQKPDKNEIVLEGFLCKTPNYRKTPFGREITDVLLAVNRGHHKADYIPVIVWGKNARFASELTTGQKVRVEGRFQSRFYDKQLQDGMVEKRIAYEVSANTIYQEL